MSSSLVDEAIERQLLDVGDDVGDVEVVNATGVHFDDQEWASIAAPVLKAIGNWSSKMGYPSGTDKRTGGIFDRDRYVVPNSRLEQMRLAQHAVEEDDVVSGAADTTERLAFNRVTAESDDPDETDIWAQIAEDLHLDALMRKAWREYFTVSTVYIATWWDRRSYKVRGKTGKNVKRKREFKDLWVPTQAATLDPLRVIPVNAGFWGPKDLAWWCHDAQEHARIKKAMKEGQQGFSALFDGPYVPNPSEKMQLQQVSCGGIQIDPSRLWQFKRNRVFAHTATKPDYERWPSVRLRSVFQILDLKQQQRQLDRTLLLGSTNFLVLITLGTDKEPAKAAELEQLHASARTIGQVPVIVGSHRLNVQIITPNSDHTLDAGRYAGLDARLSSRLYGSLVPDSSGAGRGTDPVKVARVVAAGLQAQRDSLGLTICENIFGACYEENDELKAAPPTVRMFPRHISLDFDASTLQILQWARERNEISRGSFLAELDFDQDEEAKQIGLEKEIYDDIFETVSPWGTTDPSVPGDGGRNKGGSRNGGGNNPLQRDGNTPKDPLAKPEVDR